MQQIAAAAAGVDGSTSGAKAASDLLSGGAEVLTWSTQRYLLESRAEG